MASPITGLNDRDREWHQIPRAAVQREMVEEVLHPGLACSYGLASREASRIVASDTGWSKCFVETDQSILSHAA